MKIAVASGKGGTGKTTVATSLAYLAAELGHSVAYLDCDVEEPNGHIFLRPAIDSDDPVDKPVPQIDAALCSHCGRCAEVCRFGAVASLPLQTLVFAELCHGCGGCSRACPTGAICETPRPIGRLRRGRSGEISFVDGQLDVGEAMSPPVIRAVKTAAPPAELIFHDAPPGTSCPVVESVRGCDLVLLVTEPTPFGLYDLSLAVEMTRALRLPLAVVVNRADLGNGRLRGYCAERQLPVWAELPDRRAVAEAYARGEIVAETVPEFHTALLGLLQRILRADPTDRKGDLWSAVSAGSGDPRRAQILDRLFTGTRHEGTRCD